MTNKISFALTEVQSISLPKGLTDKMRSDFNIMKELATHTRLTPDQREVRLNRFVNSIHKWVN